MYKKILTPEFVNENTIITYKYFEKVEVEVAAIKTFSKAKLEKILNHYSIALKISSENGEVGETVLIGQGEDKNLIFTPCITIDFQYLTLLEAFNSSIMIKELARRIAIVLVHENVHMEQYQRISKEKQTMEFFASLNKNIVLSDDEKENMRNYLKNPREIMAHARSVLYSLENFLNRNEEAKDFILDLIRKPEGQEDKNKNLSQISDSYKDYITYFKDDSKVLKEFKKHLYNYVKDYHMRFKFQLHATGV